MFDELNGVITMNEDVIYALELFDGNQVMQKTLAKAFNSFYTLQYNNYEEDLTDLITSESFLDRTKLLDQIVALVKTGAMYCLEQFTLTINKDANFGDLIDVLDIMVTLSNIDDFSEISGILENTGDELPIDVLTDIVSVISDINTGTFQEVVEDTAPVLLTRLSERIEEKKSIGSASKIETNRNIINNLKDIYKQYPESLGVRMILDNIRPGKPINFYLEMIDKDKDPELLAIDLYSIMVISGNTNIDTIDKVKNYLYKTVFPGEANKVNKIIDLILSHVSDGNDHE